MRRQNWPTLALLMIVALVLALAASGQSDPRSAAPPGRSEVVFWHFWGGQDRPLVEEIVERFNASQDEYFVRAVAMPGNNLDLKFFLSVSGGDPPDVVNQDDPIVADWAYRGALVPLSELATPAECAELEHWLFPAARALGSYDGQLYALCNGLDVRALYYDKTVLDSFGLTPPRTIAELDNAAVTIAPPDAPGPRKRFGYLPDPRRIWSWGIVFGGQFYDERTGKITADSPPIVDALDWMASYGERYGTAEVAAFRSGDQALAGAAFPLLQGRYAMIMDGQWRVREIEAAQAAARTSGREVHEFGVVPLPRPPGGRDNAGWVNGNFFIVPRGARQPAGAWAFMKFWSGFGGYQREAARSCVAGGWIPASQQVVEQPEFEDYLARTPLFRVYVELANSPHQAPVPAIPVAAFFQSEIIRAAELALYRGEPAEKVLEGAADSVRARLRAVTEPR